MAFYKIIGEDIHKAYAGCRQQAKWNVNAISGTGKSNGYIVQKVNLQVKPDFNKSNISYYEAWVVKDGVCLPSGEVDDTFAFGKIDMNNSLEDEVELDLIIKCIDIKGIVTFESAVFWIPKDNELSEIVAGWTHEVIEAGYLLSSYSFDELDDNGYIFQRQFIHEWDFTDENQIMNVLVSALDKTFFGKHRSENVKIAIETIKGHDEMKKEIKEAFGI